jgi:hypothetical protein
VWATCQSLGSRLYVSGNPGVILVPTRSQPLSSVHCRAGNPPRCIYCCFCHFQHRELPFRYKGPESCASSWLCKHQCRITIDMTKLNSVAVNGHHTVASVGAGATWLDVYLYLDPLGLSVAGGRNGTVGVGGLTPGGRISYFAPRVGWACDNVVNFEVCLASSPISKVLQRIL